jgi:hypothetical protein
MNVQFVIIIWDKPSYSSMLFNIILWQMCIRMVKINTGCPLCRTTVDMTHYVVLLPLRCLNQRLLALARRVNWIHVLNIINSHQDDQFIIFSSHG